MIVVYTSPGCASCRKVKGWLKERNLNYIEKNIFKTLLIENEIKHLLSRSENGTDDIISKRSKIMKEKNIDLDELSFNDVVLFIQKNPSVLKLHTSFHPKHSEKVFQIGYDEEEISAFIPPELRNLAQVSCNHACPNYQSCGQCREEA